MSRSQSAGDRQLIDNLDWIVLALLLVLSAIYAYVGWTVSSSSYLALAVGLLLAAVGSRTSAWDPILYLLIALVLTVETVRSILEGSWQEPIVAVAIFLGAVYLVLAIYLFAYKEQSDGGNVRM